MQGWRQPQPSGTNRPSSYPSHPRGRSCMCLAGATHLRSKRDAWSVELAVRPPGHAERFPFAWEAISSSSTSAAHRSAAMAGGARPDPFRTRKLSRRAPMVLRGQPVGEQGAADRWTALDPHLAGSGAGAPRGIPLRGAPFLSLSPYEFAGPSGALFACRGGRRSRAAPRPPARGPPASPGPDAFSAPGDSRAPRSRRGPCGPLSQRCLHSAD